MDLLGRGFINLQHYTQTDRQTDRQTDATESITTPHSRAIKSTDRYYFYPDSVPHY